MKLFSFWKTGDSASGPVRPAAPPKKRARGHRVDFDYLKPGEVEALLGSAQDERERAILHSFYYLGVRCNELRMMNVDDLDFEEGTVRVLHAKGGKQRLLPLDSEALEPALRAWLAVRPDARDEHGEALFPTSTSPRISNRYLRTLVKRWGARAGVGKGISQGLHPHAMRHTTLTLMVQAGEDLRTAQEFAGHSSPATTALYTSVNLSMKRRAKTTLRRVIAGEAEGN